MASIPPRQRLDAIEQYLREHHYADLNTLAETFDASLSTIRRALNELETQGIVRRHHGGASLADDESTPGGYDFITQDNRQSAAKHALARHLARQIQPGMTVMLDGGTTTYAVARLLVGQRIIVVTNSLPIAALYNEVSAAETIVVGGTVYNRLGVLYGPVCEATLREMHADIAILGAAGVTAEGIWNSNTMIAAYQREMIRASDATCFVFDHSKFGKRALTLATSFRENLRVVSSQPPPAAIARAITQAGAKSETVEVVVDEEAGE